MATAYIALGSNLGDRSSQLLAAIRDLNATPGIRVRRLSTFHDTSPVGGPVDQPRFLNAVAELESGLPADELLDTLLKIEAAHGRIRTVKDGPRTLDLDLLLYGDQISHSEKLTLPHPRMHERSFVLKPLAEIAPEVTHPVLRKSIRSLLNELPPEDAPAEKPPVSKHQRAGNASQSLFGQRALVTGSTSGVGLAIARNFAKCGADVIVHGRRPADSVVDELASQGNRVRALRCNLADRSSLATLVNDAWETWDGLDIVVLNAGADTLTGDAAKWSFDRKLDELLAVDVVSSMLLGREFGNRMVEQGHGSILTVGWDQAETGMEGDSGQLFAACKSAVMAFSRSLAVSLAPTVRVNCLALGWIRTAWGETAPGIWQDRVYRETLLRRWGTPDDVAETAAWLSSPAASFITGQTIRINGGAVR